MNITKADIIARIRTAIDDILPAANTTGTVVDSFANDADAELWQAAIDAATELSVELPINLLDVMKYQNTGGTINCYPGAWQTQLPEEYLRFVSLTVSGWLTTVRELIEPGSDEEKMQRSSWSQGTKTKPKAMLAHNDDSKRIMVWWPGGQQYNTMTLMYVARPKVTEPAEAASGTEAGTNAPPLILDDDEPEAGATGTEGTIQCGIRQEALRFVVYRAASIFFEGKKEDTIAEKFRSMSTNY